MPNLGGSINVTPSTGVAVGKPYPLGSSLVGIVDRPLVANKPGAVDLTFGRVVSLPKPTGAGTDYAAGSKVYWYSGAAVTGVTGVQAGYTIAAAATTDTSVRVTLFPGS